VKNKAGGITTESRFHPIALREVLWAIKEVLMVLSEVKELPEVHIYKFMLLVIRNVGADTRGQM